MTDGAAFAPGPPQIAEAVERLAACFGFAQAFSHQLAAAHGEMELELRVDFFVDGRTAEAEREAFAEIH